MTFSAKYGHQSAKGLTEVSYADRSLVPLAVAKALSQTRERDPERNMRAPETNDRDMTMRRQGRGHVDLITRNELHWVLRFNEGLGK